MCCLTSHAHFDIFYQLILHRELGEERSVTCVGTTTASTAAKRRRLNSGEHQLMCVIRNAIDPIPISGIPMGPDPKYTKSRIMKDLGAASIMKMKHLKKRCDMAKDALAMMQEGRGPSFIQYMVRGCSLHLIILQHELSHSVLVNSSSSTVAIVN